MSKTLPERVARIEALVENIADEQTELRSDVKSLLATRHRAAGVKDFTVVGISLLATGIGLIFTTLKIKALGG